MMFHTGCKDYSLSFQGSQSYRSESHTVTQGFPNPQPNRNMVKGHKNQCTKNTGLALKHISQMTPYKDMHYNIGL